MSTVAQRVSGVLLGLAAGDKNGGPQRLALMLAYSVYTQQKFDINNIWDCYAKWYQKGGFDTGATFVTVYKKLKFNNNLTPKQVSKSEYDDAISNNRLPSVGIGSAHRAATLAMFPFFTTPFDQIQNKEKKKNDDNKDNKDDIEENKNDNDDGNQLKKKELKCMKLEDAAFEESCLTHYAPLSRSCSIAVNYLCRALIMGYSWQESLKLCHKYIEDETVKKILMIYIDNKGEINKNNYKIKLDAGGYAPQVFKAALYFVNEYESFEKCLTASVQFAGGANYCPVLVGSIAGARYGGEAVVNSIHFKHRENAKLISKDAMSVSIDTTDCKQMRISDYEVKLGNDIALLWV